MMSCFLIPQGCTFQRCTKYSVSVHYRERHTDEKVCTCEICGKTMLRGAMRQHMEVHKDASDRRRAKCDYCGMMILQQCLQVGHMFCIVINKCS